LRHGFATLTVSHVTFDELIDKGARAKARKMAPLCEQLGLTEDDVAQAVAVKAAESPPAGGTDGEIVNWAKAVARSYIIDAHRRAWWLVYVGDPFENGNLLSGAIDDRLKNVDGILFIDDIVRYAEHTGYANPALLRAVLRARYNDPKATAKEIAKVTGTTPAEVYQIRYYAEHVGALLLERDGEHR
jgi:hypothetical protein